MVPFSHRDYFRVYRLNVEQYGEILVSIAFDGEKMGDAQRGYDIEIPTAKFRDKIKIDDNDTSGMLREEADQIRIEVKSKLSLTGKPKKGRKRTSEVVPCGDCKLDGKLSKTGTKHPGMTHLAIVIVQPGSRTGCFPEDCPPEDEGKILHAWLLTNEMAREMRKKSRKDTYISIGKLEKWASSSPPPDGVIDIKPQLSRAAESQVEKR